MREKKERGAKSDCLIFVRLIFNEPDVLYVFAHARKNYEQNADTKDKRGGMSNPMRKLPITKYIFQPKIKEHNF